MMPKPPFCQECLANDVGEPAILTRQTTANGMTAICWQCQGCYQKLGSAVAQREIDDVEALPAFNQVAREAYRKGEQAARKAAGREALRRMQIERAQFNAFYETENWKRISKKIKSRDKQCRSCGDAKATQAHHLTYRYGLDAPLFALVGVCRSCHTKIHNLQDTEVGQAPTSEIQNSDQ